MDQSSEVTSELTGPTLSCRMETPSEMSMGSFQEESDCLAQSQVFIKTEPHEDESEFRDITGTYEMCPNFNNKTDEPMVRMECEDMYTESVQDPLDVENATKGVYQTKNSSNTTDNKLYDGGQARLSLQNTEKTVNLMNSRDTIQWSRNNTLLLIEWYKKYRNKVGTAEIKNQKRMWSIIANKFLQSGIQVTASNVENRWRVLERNHKKLEDSIRSTGRVRKYFEFQSEMEEILGTKTSSNPAPAPKPVSVVDSSINTNVEIAEHVNQETRTENCQPSCSKVIQPSIRGRTRLVHPRRFEKLEKLKKVKEDYYNKKLEIYNRKIAMEEKKLENKIENDKKKLQERIRRNNLLEERNQILKLNRRQESRNCKNCNLDNTKD